MTRQTLHWGRLLAVTAAALCAVGVWAQFMVGRPDGTHAALRLALRQSLAVGLAAVLGLAIARVPPNVWRRIAPGLAVANIVLLILVLALGHEANGAQRWIALGPFGLLQPSELSKPAVVHSLAAYLARRRNAMSNPSTALGSLLVVGPPVALIALQPDLGTALVIVGIWLSMLFVAGVPGRTLAAIVAVGAIVFAGLWHTPIIHDYQKDRLTVFLRPASEPSSASAHIRASMRAIRSGGWTGTKTPRKLAKSVPERDTDFVFTVVARRGGFVGGLVVLALFGAMLSCAWKIAEVQPNGFGDLVSAGLIAMWAIHIIVNVGMTMRLCPIVGVPLPLISRGGTAMVVNLASAGLLLALYGAATRRKAAA